jgi:Phage integrase family
MQAIPQLDRAGRRRSPATTSSFHQGVAPANKGRRYPPDPPTVDEIIAVMRTAGNSPEGVRLRGVIVVLWRAGLRISEALALNETDLDADRGALLIRHGKGDKRREVGMDRWAWSHLEPWLKLRSGLPVGRLSCAVRGPTQGRPCAGRDPSPTAPDCTGSRTAAPVRAAPTAACARRRDVAGGDLADRDPAPARARRSRDHVSISPRYRQHRDHPGRASASRAHDPCKQTRALTLSRVASRFGREAATFAASRPCGATATNGANALASP